MNKNGMNLSNEMGVEALLALCSSRLETVFSHYLNHIPSPDLKSAMEYSLWNGGKRLRPLFVYATGCAFNAPLESLDIPASAVELMHTYSLIHDDLPCMDNADLRRGKPSSHKVYGDGMAVLTGDALLTLTMQVIASHPGCLSDPKRVQMMNKLSLASGPFGMVAGQALDITMMSDKNITDDLLLNIYRLKTGVLLSSCVQMGYLASTDDDEINQKAMLIFGDNIGLAFQIQDDILDVESNSQLSGKPQGLDMANNKITYPRLHGINAAKLKVQSLYEEALETINYLGNQARLLRELTQTLLQRNC